MHWAIYFSLVQSVLVWYPIARGNTFCQECRRVVPTATGTPHNRDNNIEIPAFSILVVDCMEQTFLKSWDETPVCLQPPNFVAKDVVRKFFPVEILPECPDTEGRIVSIRPVFARTTVRKGIREAIGNGVPTYLAIWGIEDFKFRPIRPEKCFLHISPLWMR